MMTMTTMRTTATVTATATATATMATTTAINRKKIDFCIKLQSKKVKDIDYDSFIHWIIYRMQLLRICYAANAFSTKTLTHTDQSINSVYLLSHNSVVRDHLSPFEIITKENGNVLHDRTKMYAYIKCDEKKERKKERRMENKIRRTSEVSVYFSRATLWVIVFNLVYIYTYRRTRCKTESESTQGKKQQPDKM